MQYFGSAKTEFDASHQLDDLPRCARLHGHRYHVEVECVGRLSHSTGMAVDLERLSQDLQTVASELHLRHLPDMLPGVIHTPFGIAAWFMERLLQDWAVTRVSVSEDGSSVAVVTREVRGVGSSIA